MDFGTIKLALRRFDHDLWIAAACEQRLGPPSHAWNVAGDIRMSGRDGRTLEPSDDHFLQRIPLVVRVHWTNLSRWGGVRADGARDHVHCMRPLRYNSRASWRFRRKAGSRCRNLRPETARIR